LHQCIVDNQYTLDQIYNFDETRFEWEVKSRFTYDFYGTDRVLGCSSNAINHALTVMLMVRADGTKLPALIIFKERTRNIPERTKRLLKIPTNVMVKSNKSGYISQDILTQYLLLELRRNEKLIIIDKCSTHTTPDLMRLYKDINANIKIIPGGCTKYLQPLDATVINSFKRRTHKERISTMMQNIDRRTKAGNIKRPTRQNLINWVSSAWDNTDYEIVQRSFKITGAYNPNESTDSLLLRHQLPMRRILLED